MKAKPIKILPLCLLWSLLLIHPATAQEDPTIEEPTEETIEEVPIDEGFQQEETIDPETITDDPNPLNPAGESLERLIEMQLNEDLWTAMRGELSCLEASEPCIRELQEMAIANSPALRAIDERVELVNQKIDEARANNQQTISLGIFEPAVQYFLRVEDLPAASEVRDSRGNIIAPAQPARRRGFFDRLGDLFGGNGTLGIINDVFSLIGVPLFRNATGGDAVTQSREIAIADLQVKIAEIENQRGNLANEIREQVVLQVLEFDTIRREFQVSQEVARRDTLRLQILEQNYRFAVGTLDTPQYLREISTLDQQRANTFRAWSRLRSQLVRVKILVLGSDS